MSTLLEVLDAAKTLTPHDRLLLLDALWDDLSPADWPVPAEEWITEAQRRSADFDAGLMSAAPWETVKARARQIAGLDE